MKLPIVLIIINHYLPGYRAGGPVRSISNLVSWLGEDFDFKILTSDRDVNNDITYPSIKLQTWQRLGKALVRYLSPQEMGFWKLREILNQLSYDLLYLDGAFSPTTLKVLSLRKSCLIPHRPTIVVPRGQLSPGALSLKSTKKQTFLKIARIIGLYRNVIWHTSNVYEGEDIQSTLGEGTKHRIYSISNLPAQISYNVADLVRIKTPGQARFLFLSRISRKKNLHFALELIKGCNGQVEFDIYGPIEDEIYWKECLEIIEAYPEHIKVTYKGIRPFDEVQDVYSNYHLFILPTLGENFGHVILEALCMGCLVLTSDRTPWDELEDRDAGWAVSLDKPDIFKKNIQVVIDMDASQFHYKSQKARLYGYNYVSHSGLVDNTRNFLYSAIERST